MNSVSLLAVVPYEGMKEVLSEAKKVVNGNVRIDMYVGDLETSLNAIRSLNMSNYAAILSRGGTAALLAEEQELPVVDVAPTLLDVLRCLRVARSISPRYAVVGFPAIADVAKKMFELIERPEEVRVIHNRSEAEITVRALKDSGYDLVIGDAVTVSSAQNINLNAILITSGKESADIAIEEALRISHACSEVKRKADILDAILSVSSGYRIVLRNDGTLFKKYLPDSPEIEHTLEEIAHTILPDLKKESPLKRFVRIKKEMWHLSGTRLDTEAESLFLFEAKHNRNYPFENRDPIELFLPSEYRKDNTADSAGVMKEIHEKAEKLAVRNLPLFVFGSIGTPAEDVLRTYFHACNAGNNTGFMIDCNQITDSLFKKLLSDEDSPLMDNNQIICFCNVNALSIQNVNALEEFEIVTRFSFRNRTVYCAFGEENKTFTKFAIRTGCAILPLPDLQSRREDIPAIAGMYISELNYTMGKQIIGVTPECMELLTNADWIGNNVQFKNALRDAMVVATGDKLEVRDILPLFPAAVSAASSSDFKIKEQMTLDEINRAAARQALRLENGNHARAAERLDISRTTLWRLLKE